LDFMLEFEDDFLMNIEIPWITTWWENLRSLGIHHL
jgi:hypothetical protein